MMNLENSWYVIERNNRYEIMPHTELARIPIDGYVILLNVPTWLDAAQEMARLIKIENETLRQKFQKITRIEDAS